MPETPRRYRGFVGLSSHVIFERVDLHRGGGRSGTPDSRPALQALFEHAMRPGSGVTGIGVHSFSRVFTRFKASRMQGCDDDPGRAAPRLRAKPHERSASKISISRRKRGSAPLPVPPPRLLPKQTPSPVRPAARSNPDRDRAGRIIGMASPCTGSTDDGLGSFIALKFWCPPGTDMGISIIGKFRRACLVGARLMLLPGGPEGACGTFSGRQDRGSAKSGRANLRTRHGGCLPSAHGLARFPRPRADELRRYRRRFRIRRAGVRNRSRCHRPSCDGG